MARGGADKTHSRAARFIFAMNEETFLYEVFIHHSGASDERDWAETLAKKLGEAGIHAATPSTPGVYDPGETELKSIERAFTISDRVIFVLTPAWLAGKANYFAAELLRYADPDARKRKLLPVLLKPCDPTQLPDAITKLHLNFADFTQADQARELKRLIGAIERTVPQVLTAPGQRKSRRRWLLLHRKQVIGLAGAALFLLALTGLAWYLLAPRDGWREVERNNSIAQLNEPSAKWLFQFGDRWLVATSTNTGCKGEDTGLLKRLTENQEWTRVRVRELDFEGRNGCDRSAIEQIAASPLDPKRLYAATSNSGLLESRDAGESWTRTAREVLPDELYSVAIAPDARRMYVTATRGGLWRLDDVNANWQRLDTKGLCQNPGSGTTLPIVATERARVVSTANAVFVAPDFNPKPNALENSSTLYVSLDAGNCWQPVFTSETYQFNALVASPFARDEIFFVATNYRNVQEQILYRFDARHGAQILWKSAQPIPAVLSLWLNAANQRWYIATMKGRVWTGAIKTSAGDAPRELGNITCSAATMCRYASLAGGGNGEMPLLLTDGKIWEWTTTNRFQEMFP